MEFSNFGHRFAKQSGLSTLMEDVNEGLINPDAIMLGGGNPASIPAVNDYLTALTQDMVLDGSMLAAIENYDGAQGKTAFIRALADLLQHTYGWPISERNIALTNGSQSAFFYLFNLFAGAHPDGGKKRILLPMAPEYIGYAELGLERDMFVSYRPEIDMLPDNQFKYRIDFSAIEWDDSVGAVCVSRPTNPTGNVLTDAELERLDELARENGIPLIIDNAYGLPFPNIIFEDVKPFWNENTVLCSSLSKLGLPGLRCGIVIANEEIIKAVTTLNSSVTLSPGSLGPAMALKMIEQCEMLKLGTDIVRPFYHDKMLSTVDLLRRTIPDPRLKIHKPEGSMFLWLWFDGLPVSTKELYQRLKKRGLLVVPGEYFFIGIDDGWPHTRQCLRMNYVQPHHKMERGIAILSEEVAKAYSGNGHGAEVCLAAPSDESRQQTDRETV